MWENSSRRVIGPERGVLGEQVRDRLRGVHRRPAPDAHERVRARRAHERSRAYVRNGCVRADARERARGLDPGIVRVCVVE